MHRPAEGRGRHFCLFLKIALFLLWLTGPMWLRAETISGTVQDPSGAVIAGARGESSGGDLVQPLVLSSDGQGKFAAPELKHGAYSVQVTREGFEPLVKTVDLQGPVRLQLTLEIAQQKTSVSVSGKILAFVNSDPVYRQLRGLGLGQTFRFDNFTLPWDVATFKFKQGTLTFLSPVNGIVTGAIFIGEGHFNLKPVTPLDARELTRRTGGAEFNEDFTEAVFRFTGKLRLSFLRGLGDHTDPSAEAGVALRNWRERMRQRREQALGFTQYLLQGETMDNVDADLLAAIYNGAHPDFFNAY